MYISPDNSNGMGAFPWVVCTSGIYIYMSPLLPVDFKLVCYVFLDKIILIAFTTIISSYCINGNRHICYSLHNIHVCVCIYAYKLLFFLIKSLFRQ